MNIFVFSDSSALSKALGKLGSMKTFTMEVLPVASMKKTIHKLDEHSLVYLDAQGKELSTGVRALAKCSDVHFGVIDQKRTVTDVADLFFSGAVDYIGAMDLKEAFSEKRMKNVVEYIKCYRSDYAEQTITKAASDRVGDSSKFVKNGWTDIRSGCEYTFAIMYIELDGLKSLEEKFGKKNLRTALESFRSYCDKHIGSFNGRLWIWQDFGGVALFPFDGKECPSVFCGYLMVLYRHLYDIEESPFPNFISFRMALHLGNVVYAENESGSVISDTVNSVFHLGKKFVKTGNFCLTSEVEPYIPAKLKSFFVPGGTFEKRHILRMRLPIFVR